MAGLINEHVPQCTPGEDSSEQLTRLVHNPMFLDLQATLMHDMNSGENVPYVLQNFGQFSETPEQVVIQPEPCTNDHLFRDRIQSSDVPGPSFVAINSNDNNNNYKSVDLNLIQGYYPPVYGKHPGAEVQEEENGTSATYTIMGSSTGADMECRSSAHEDLPTTAEEHNNVKPVHHLPSLTGPMYGSMSDHERGSPEKNIIRDSFQTALQLTSPMKQEPKQFDLIVEDATLQAEFRQLAPMGNAKVMELEHFYNRQSAEIIMQRTDATSMLTSKGLDPGALDKEMRQLSGYFDQQHEHLVQRISQSLQLLKEALPREQSQGQLTLSSKNKQAKSRLLNGKAVSVMNEWYQKHIDYPYPTDEEKQYLAECGNISLSQVKAWFANKRNRSLNTKPKRQKAKLAHELSHICQKLAHAKEMGGDINGAKSYNVILRELSSMTQKPSVSRNGFPNTLSLLQGQGQQTGQGHLENFVPVANQQPAPPLFPYYMNMQMQQ